MCVVLCAIQCCCVGVEKITYGKKLQIWDSIVILT